ncbi:MAG: hypothetical protein C0483_10515 [Pirellula sp.]|nr:hypothetical protein [Pirellula sp.]
MEEARYVRLRTSVVVVSMLVLPTAAVFGVKMPAESLASKRSEPAKGGTSPTPPAEQLARNGQPARTSGLLPKSGEESASTSPAREVMQAGGHLDSPAPHGGPAIATASANIDVLGSSTPESLGPSSQSALSFGLDSAARSLPTAPPSPGESSTLANAEILHPAASPQSAPTSGAGLEQFTQIQQRLRALGATHYALETWGTDGQLYRFQCRMAAGHTADYTRQFEATDTDALRSMLTVLEEVEAWKAGRLP